LLALAALSSFGPLPDVVTLRHPQFAPDVGGSLADDIRRVPATAMQHMGNRTRSVTNVIQPTNQKLTDRVPAHPMAPGNQAVMIEALTASEHLSAQGEIGLDRE